MEDLLALAATVMAEIDAELVDRGINAMWELRHYESGRMVVQVYGPRGTDGIIDINEFSSWLEMQPVREVEDGSCC